MKESIFANEMKKSIEEQTLSLFTLCFYYKIPDSYGNERFTPLKPFDAFFIKRVNNISTSVALEYKMLKEKKSFPFSSVRPNQIDGLMKFSKIGKAFILINYRFQNKDGRVNRAFVIEIDKFNKMICELNRKSIPYIMFDKCDEMEFITELPRISGGWDCSYIM